MYLLLMFLSCIHVIAWQRLNEINSNLGYFLLPPPYLFRPLPLYTNTQWIAALEWEKVISILN